MNIKHRIVAGVVISAALVTGFGIGNKTDDKPHEYTCATDMQCIAEMCAWKHGITWTIEDGATEDLDTLQACIENERR